ncbi:MULTISPECIES: hypothetical protein [unclassified Rhizobium]|uniref:hypothetical protein n=1 Tax=unclassified Rhizobium TaxID=2613769 RepID=UPI001FCDDAC7|nr:MULTISPECIES: hypothetical protein [unclassified Rhizobium]
MTVYGLLSASLDQSANAQGLRVDVPIEPFNGESWPLSLAPSYHKVLAGFAAEYLPALFRGVEDLRESAPSFGILSFDRMAHSDIGSSIDGFRELTRAILRALTMTQVPETPKRRSHFWLPKECRYVSASIATHFRISLSQAAARSLRHALMRRRADQIKCRFRAVDDKLHR